MFFDFGMGFVGGGIRLYPMTWLAGWLAGGKGEGKKGRVMKIVVAIVSVSNTYSTKSPVQVYIGYIYIPSCISSLFHTKYTLPDLAHLNI